MTSYDYASKKKTSYGFRLTSKAVVEIVCFLCFLAKALLLFSQQLPLFLLMQLPLSLLHSTDRTPDSKGINNGKAGWGDDIRDTFTWLSKSSSNHRQNLYLKNIQCQETKINSVSLPSPHGEMGSWQRYGRNIPYHLGPLPPGMCIEMPQKNTPNPPINEEQGPLLLGQRTAKLPAMLCSIQHQSILALSN